MSAVTAYCTIGWTLLRPGTCANRPGARPNLHARSDMPKRTCSIDGCDRPGIARQMCGMHWQRWRKTNEPTRPSIGERFWAKVDKTGTCWLWTGSKDRHGYGHIGIGGRITVLAHRFSYEEIVGPIPDGLVLDHLCRNPPCVNPAHLEAVTQALNVQRARPFATTCPNGHEYTAENTRIDCHGYRRCRICDRRRYMKEAARMKSVRAARRMAKI